ncbi:MAG: type III pantothenate kinase [Victivallaceae bacterium]|nr:type III pantothenate kinase [Victivallaceae bacterium]
MVILLNIGNTHTGIAEAAAGGILSSRKVLTAELTAAMLPPGIPVAAATVVPKFRARFKGREIFWLEPGFPCGIDLSRIDQSTCGADRLANVIALAEFFPLPALCIDFGTAVTFELLDENRVFRGGAIVPGRKLLRNSLHDYTAQLPLAELEIPPPAGPGTTTVEQMCLGMDIGLVGAVKELIGIMRRAVNTDLKVVATGGDAGFFIKNLSGIEYAGDDFTLKGILKAWEINCKCR